MNKVLLAVLLTICVGSLTGLGMPVQKDGQLRKRAQKPAETQTTSEPEVDEFTNATFDWSLASLPMNFRGVNPQALADSIKNSPLLAPKSEFETTTAYKARVLNFQSAQLLGGLNPSQTIAFVVRPNPVYDADKAQFTVELPFITKKLLLVDGEPQAAELELETHLLGRELYQASNAMGATTTVEETTYGSAGIAVDPQSWLIQYHNPNPLFGKPAFTFRVPLDVAPGVRDKLAVALIGALASPWLAKDIFYKDPTLEKPVKLISAGTFMWFRPAEVVIFRSDTGEVLKRVTPLSAMREALLPRKLGAFQ